MKKLRARERTSTTSYHVYGMAAAWTAVEALRQAGKNLTRESLVKALEHSPRREPFPAARDRRQDGQRDHYPIEQMLLQRWQKAPGGPSAASGASAPRSISPLGGGASAASARLPQPLRVHMLEPPARGDRPATQHESPMAHLVSELLNTPLDDLMAEARCRAPRAPVTYSPKVFIPLTTLCRDVCGYCTFARPPRRGERAFMTESTRCSRSRAPAPPQAAPRRCSRSATSPSSATGSRGRSSLQLGFETTIEYLGALRGARARRDRPAPAPQPGRDEPG